MSSIDLILKDIEDPYTRENFFRLSNYIGSQTILDGQWKFYQIDLPSAVVEYKFKHNLSFTPKDVIILSASGNKRVDFRYDLFTRDHIVLTAEGAVTVRFLAGAYNEKGFRSNLKDLAQNPPWLLPSGPPPASSAPRLIETFVTDVGTSLGNLVRVNGPTSVTKIVDNLATTVPNGIFGLVYSKPTPLLAEVLFVGIMNGYAGFSPGSPLFISTSGTPTHSVPGTGVVQQIGFAVTANSFFLQMMTAMIRS